jgi:hypothetical protein
MAITPSLEIIMAEKSAKGQKIGRHNRGTSNKLQAARTARNKAANIKFFGATPIAACPKIRGITKDEVRLTKLANEGAARLEHRQRIFGTAAEAVEALRKVREAAGWVR